MCCNRTWKCIRVLCESTLSQCDFANRTFDLMGAGSQNASQNIRTQSTHCPIRNSPPKPKPALNVNAHAHDQHRRRPFGRSVARACACHSPIWIDPIWTRLTRFRVVRVVVAAVVVVYGLNGFIAEPFMFCVSTIACFVSFSREFLPHCRCTGSLWTGDGRTGSRDKPDGRVNF